MQATTVNDTGEVKNSSGKLQKNSVGGAQLAVRPLLQIRNSIYPRGQSNNPISGGDCQP